MVFIFTPYHIMWSRVNKSVSVCSCRFASSEQPWEVPEWFLDDERKHRKKPVPVTRDMVEEYKQKWKEIDARPIKRVAEAKARKKRRVRIEKTMYITVHKNKW